MSDDDENLHISFSSGWPGAMVAPAVPVDREQPLERGKAEVTLTVPEPEMLKQMIRKTVKDALQHLQQLEQQLEQQETK